MIAPEGMRWAINPFTFLRLSFVTAVVYCFQVYKDENDMSELGECLLVAAFPLSLS